MPKCVLIFTLMVWPSLCKDQSNMAPWAMVSSAKCLETKLLKLVYSDFSIFRIDEIVALPLHLPIVPRDCQGREKGNCGTHDLIFILSISSGHQMKKKNNTGASISGHAPQLAQFMDFYTITCRIHGLFIHCRQNY